MRAADWQSEDGAIRLYRGDCLEVMPLIPSGSVDLVVTSPPYSDQRKTTYGGTAACDYVEWFLPISEEIRRVLKPNGSFVLNIKEKAAGGERSTYVIELILALRKQGWLWTEEYIWHKRNCFPGKWPNRFRDAWERCLHFTKQKQFAMYQDAVRVPMGEWAKRLERPTALDKERQVNSTQSGFGRRRANWIGRDLAYPTNVLRFATECGNKGHSAAFPLELPTWFVRLLTLSGETVLDPFGGSMTTALAAQSTGRRFIGIERDPGYFDVAVTRCKEALGTTGLFE